MSKKRPVQSLPLIIPFITILGIASLSSCKTVTQEQGSTKADSDTKANELLGEWIQYRNGQFQIKTISDAKEVNGFYNEFGDLRGRRTMDIAIESSKNTGPDNKRVLVGPKASWDYLAGGKKPEGLKWTSLNFDPKKNNWKTGKAGFGYADDDDETVLDDMINKYTSVYIRKEFEITKNTDLSRLALAINYDDGFVLYLNGRYVFSINVANEEGKLAVGNHEANGVEYFILAPFADALTKGKNVIAIEGHNAKLDSSDFTLDPQLIVGGGYTNFVKSNINAKNYDLKGTLTEEKKVDGKQEGGYMITDGILRQSQAPKDGTVSAPSGAFRKASESGQQLLIAARNGNTSKITSLLKSGVSVDFTTPGSYTALAYAAARDHLKAASLLLKNGADINKQARWDKSPLLLVAGTKNLKAAQFLLDKGADLNAVQFWKATCLHEAVFWNQPETLKYFISKGLSPNTVANNGSSPLHWTIWRINKEKEESIKQSAVLINILLDSGVDKSLKTKDGKTAADLAKDKGLEKIAALIKP